MANQNMPDHNKKHEDNITNRVLVIFSTCMVGVLALMYLSGLLGSTRYMIGLNVAKGGMFVGAVLVLLGLYLWAKERRAGDHAPMKIIYGRYVIIAGLFLEASMLLITRYGMGMFPLCYGTLIAIAFLYLIFHSYPVEFFVIACDCAAGLGLLAVASALSFGSIRMGGLVLAVVLAVAQVALVVKMKGAKGTLTLGKREYTHKFSDNAYKMLTITPVVMAACVAVGAFGSAIVTYVAYGAMATYFFVSGVYYTVKNL